MTQKDLFYIKTIVEEGGISQAAKKLYLAQPSLSQTVRRIEDSLGVPLFKRTPHGIILTQAGADYYRMACQILRMYHNFEEEVENLHNLKKGTIEVGVTTHRGQFLLPGFLADFYMRYPGITVLVTEDTTENVESLLLCGKLDFAIMRAPAGGQCNKNISFHGLSRDSFVILLPPGHPLKHEARPGPGKSFLALDLSLLKNESFLLHAENMRIRQNIDILLKNGGLPNPHVVYTSIYSETLVRLVAAGRGVSILPDKLAHLPFLDRWPEYFEIMNSQESYWEIGIMTLGSSYIPKAAAVFIEEFQRYMETRQEKAMALSLPR